MTSADGGIFCATFVGNFLQQNFALKRVAINRRLIYPNLSLVLGWNLGMFWVSQHLILCRLHLDIDLHKRHLQCQIVSTNFSFSLGFTLGWMIVSNLQRKFWCYCFKEAFKGYWLVSTLVTELTWSRLDLGEWIFWVKNDARNSVLMISGVLRIFWKFMFLELAKIFRVKEFPSESFRMVSVSVISATLCPANIMQKLWNLTEGKKNFKILIASMSAWQKRPQKTRKNTSSRETNALPF